MAREIRKVAVLGAGVMGAGIAAHLANAGIESLLYDIVPKDAKDRNALALKGVETARTARPAAFFVPELARHVTAVNFDDHADRLKEADWIVEVVVERIDVKQKVYAWVAQHRRPGSIVSSNTSGLSLADMTAAMPDEMRRHFLVTHFFNPVRYMRLLELVGHADLDAAALATIVDFAERRLGKGVVFAKDTPNFIANRIGTYGLASVFRHMKALGMNVEQVDAVFGPPMGRPKSAVFRTIDLVGLDVLAHTFDTVREGCPDDEERDAFVVPESVKTLMAAGRLGEKTGEGFYKKVKTADGKSDILVYDFATGAYRAKEKVRYPSIGKARGIDDPAKSTKVLLAGDDDASKLAWAVTADTLVYSARRIPEIADDVVNVDRAMRWGFAWEVGPFESWDALGVGESVARMEAEGRVVPAWVKAMLAHGRTSFYARDERGTRTYWDPASGSARPVPVSPDRIEIDTLRATNQVIAYNASASLLDIGDGVGCLEFHSKMNSLDDLIFELYEKALDRLEAGELTALVVANQNGKAFSAGANVLGIAMGAMQKEWAAIDAAVARLQRLMQRARYSRRPVVTAPYGLTLGGGAEVAMHGSATRAGGELYIGLVEAGMGLVPAGGGCKELLMRHAGAFPQDVSYDPNPFVQKVFERIGLAKVATSAEEARAWGFLRPTDGVTMDPDRLVADAKRTALALVASDFQPLAPRTARVPGRSGIAAIELFLYQMHEGGFATDHDVTVGKQLAHVLTGGDVPSGAIVTEERVLELEREAFLHLCGTEATLARIQNFLQTGKVLRN
jgi:3-hydroxyacyl-CoA dehydrogenase